MFNRYIHLPNILATKSSFLLGPRSTGKSTLITMQLPTALVIDLLESDIFAHLGRRPEALRELTADHNGIVVIDEVQKLPKLLDEVHLLIERRKLRFLLTGSSARKLRRGAANLLGGRARETQLFPLTSQEIGKFSLERYLQVGGLPAIYQSLEPWEDLLDYVDLYLRDEVLAEAAVRNLQPFAMFLDAVAISSGGELSYENFAADCGVAPNTIKHYVEVLEDTLIAFRVPPFTLSRKRRAITRSKLYLFDIGVMNRIAKRKSIASGTPDFGTAFEHFIAIELRSYLAYSRSDLNLSYWRSTSGFEVDLIVGQYMAVEIKATESVHDKHLKGLRALKEEQLLARHVVVSQDPMRRKTEDGIEIWPWQDFITAVWQGVIFDKT
jgi:predicted AAA+ superfamily ATPase